MTAAGVVGALAVVYSTTVAERLGLIPYGPLFRSPPIDNGRVADTWLWSSMIWPPVIACICFVIFAFLLGRARRQAERVVEMKEAAEEASRSKGAFLATVSHELRTPLTSILGFAKLIKKRLADVVTRSMAGNDCRHRAY